MPRRLSYEAGSESDGGSALGGSMNYSASGISTGIDSEDSRIWIELAGEDDLIDENEENENELETSKSFSEACFDGLDKCVSYTKQVVIMIMLPVLFLVVFTLIPLSAAATHIYYIQHHRMLVAELGSCQHNVLREEILSMAVAGYSNESKPELYEARRLVDVSCGKFERQLDFSTDYYFSQTFYEKFREWSQNMTRLRVYVEQHSIHPEDVFDSYHDFLGFLSSQRLYFASKAELKDATRFFIELSLMWTSVNFLSHVQALGGALLADDLHPKLTIQERESLKFRLHESFQAYAEQLRHYHRYAIGSVGEAFYNSVILGAEGRAASTAMKDYIINQKATTFTTWMNTLSKGNTRRMEQDLNTIDTIVNIYVEELAVSVAFAGAAIVLSGLIIAYILAANHRIRRHIVNTIVEQRHTERAIRRFVPKKFLNLVGCTKITQVTAGEPTDIALTMLFTDIRKFTQLSHTMTNSALFIWLQSYFSRMTVVVEKNRGFIDQFIGDAIFALFSSADCSLQCGCEMQAKAQQINSDIIVAGGSQLLCIGVGIHHAAVSVGFLGDEKRLSTTIVSPEVGIASKLEALTKLYGGEILCSEVMFVRVTKAFLVQIAYRLLGVAKDEDGEITIYEVFQTNELSLKEHKAQTARAFREGVEQQRSEDYVGAIETFQSILTTAKSVGLSDKAAQFKLQQVKAGNVADQLESEALVENSRSGSGHDSNRGSERRQGRIRGKIVKPSTNQVLPLVEVRTLNSSDEDNDPMSIDLSANGVSAIPEVMVGMLQPLTGTSQKKPKKKQIVEDIGFSTGPLPNAPDDDDDVQSPSEDDPAMPQDVPGAAPSAKKHFSVPEFEAADNTNDQNPGTPLKKRPGKDKKNKPKEKNDKDDSRDESAPVEEEQQRPFLERCWAAVDKNVSFSTQVTICVFILVLLCLAVSVYEFVPVSAQTAYLDYHFPLFHPMGECQMNLLNERGFTIQYLTHPDNASLAKLLLAHHQFDHSRKNLLSKLEQVFDPFVKDQWSEEFQKTIHNITEVRYRVKNFLLSTNEAIELYNKNGYVFGDLRDYFGSHDIIRHVAKDVFELGLSWAVANDITWLRELGVVAIYELKTAGAVAQGTVRKLFDAAGIYQDTVILLLEVASPFTKHLQAQNANSALAKRATQMISNITADVTLLPTNVTDWYESLSALVGDPNEFDLHITQQIRISVSEEMNLQILELVVGILLCCVAAAAIIHGQMRLDRKVERKIEVGRLYRKKAEAFVPRQFLLLCEAESLDAVKPGTHTETSVAILFSHIRGYGGLSTTLSKSELFEWLQNYFSSMSAIVEANHGFVDKFIGDAVLAAFTAAKDASNAAVCMQGKTQNMNTELIIHNKTSMVHIGIGMHLASVAVGFLGDEHRLTSTMISKEVNMASRLEGMTKVYGTDIIFSQALYESLRVVGDDKEFKIRHLGQIVAKGAVAPYRIFELYQADPIILKQYKEKTKERFERAVWLRETGDTTGSLEMFRDIENEALAAGVVDRVLLIKLSHSGCGEAFMRK